MHRKKVCVNAVGFACILQSVSLFLSGDSVDIKKELFSDDCKYDDDPDPPAVSCRC